MQMARLVLLTALFVFVSGTASAQTTAFNYQGSLRDGANVANGNYDFEFALFDALSGGAQLGSTLTRSTVAVANGTFAVSLDFGSQFPGADRFLEIRVRLTGGGAFTPLTPRSSVNSAPYSVKSITADNATQLGGVAANQYVTTTSGGTNFIQNTASPQPASNFNLSGNGTAGGTLSGNIVNTNTQYNIGGNRALSMAGVENIFVGATGGGNTTGSRNTLVGSMADVGSPFLTNATAIGALARVDTSNSIVLGSVDGLNGAIVNTNVGIGTTFPQTPLEIRRNSTIASDWQTGQIRIAGQTDPNKQLSLGYDTTNNLGVIQAGQAFTGFKALSLNPFGGNVGIGTTTPGVNDKLVVVGNTRIATGTLYLPGILGGGANHLCIDANAGIVLCSSSLKYKTGIGSFSSGLALIKNLKPITFDWKNGGMHDLGLGAEDVEKIEPLLVTYNKDGQVEGVKYDRIGVVLINAVKEQQEQIDAQKKTINHQQNEIDELRQIVCELKPTAKGCSSR